MKTITNNSTIIVSKWARFFGAMLILAWMVSAVAFSAATTPNLVLPTNANANQGLTPTLSWSTATGSGTITYHLQVATKADFSVGLVDYTPLTPTSHQLPTLSSNTTYYWHVVAMDNGVEGTYSTTWSFETGAMQLGTAANFGILAAGAILGGNPTLVTGNVGTNAGGVTLTTVSAGYTIYDYSIPADKSIVDAGQSDLHAVYTDAYLRPGSVAIAADLGGQTLTPGVYNIVGVAAMSSSMTFNGHGVYIIQLGSFISTTGGVTVNLTGSAVWTDIFWVVNDYVELGAGTTFEGTVMATNYISVGASASPVHGRLLSKGAYVTVGAPTAGGSEIPLPVEVEIGLAPQKFALLQNYPNPFNPSTKIQYSLANAAQVSLKVYNVLGLEVATLVNGRQEAGSYTVPFSAIGGNTSTFASGVYFYRLEAGSFVSTKKLILMK